MLAEFNEGRSRSYLCIAATVLDIERLRDALPQAREKSAALEVKDKSRVMRSVINSVASRKNYYLKFRK